MLYMCVRVYVCVCVCIGVAPHVPKCPEAEQRQLRHGAAGAGVPSQQCHRPYHCA